MIEKNYDSAIYHTKLGILFENSDRKEYRIKRAQKRIKRYEEQIKQKHISSRN